MKIFRSRNAVFASAAAFAMVATPAFADRGWGGGRGYHRDNDDTGAWVIPLESYGMSAGFGAASYLWSNGATSPTITVSAAGSYSVTVVDSNGCTAASLPTAVAVSALPSAAITASGPTSFCAGGSVTLSAPAGMSSYAWSNGSTTPSINVTAGGNYAVTVQRYALKEP